jgi:hypothetical protein
VITNASVVKHYMSESHRSSGDALAKDFVCCIVTLSFTTAILKYVSTRLHCMICVEVFTTKVEIQLSLCLVKHYS